MNKIAGNFMKVAVIYALAGFALGIVMGITNDHGLSSAHAHANLVGWVMMTVFAFFYQLVPAASRTGLAKAQFWLSFIGSQMLIGSVAMLVYGINAQAGAAIGSMMTLASLLIFVFVVFRSTGGAYQEI